MPFFIKKNVTWFWAFKPAWEADFLRFIYPKAKETTGKDFKENTPRSRKKKDSFRGDICMRDFAKDFYNDLFDWLVANAAHLPNVTVNNGSYKI